MNASERNRDWRKSSFCSASSACVEISMAADGVRVRDGKASELGPVLSFTPQEWVAFLDGVRAGEFDAA